MQEAPHPDDVIWERLEVRGKNKRFKRYRAYASFFALLIGLTAFGIDMMH